MLYFTKFLDRSGSIGSFADTNVFTMLLISNNLSFLKAFSRASTRASTSKPENGDVYIEVELLKPGQTFVMKCSYSVLKFKSNQALF